MIEAEAFTSPARNPKSIAVIGGGVASACVIDQIFRISPDCKITLFCADNEIACRASGNKQGAVYPLLQGSKSKIAQLLAVSYVYATDYYQKLHQAGLEFEHQWCGVLQQAIKPELEARYQKVAACWPDIVEYVDTKRSSELAGLDLPYPSLYFDKGGWLWPQQFCQELLNKLALQYPLSIHLNTPIASISLRECDTWFINNTLEFDAVIVANGHQSHEFELTKDFSTEPVRGQVSRLQSDSSLNPLKTVLCHKGYVTPAQGHYQCFGATFEKGSTCEANLTADQTTNLRQIQSVYPDQNWAQSLSESQVIGNKSGIRATTKDHLPMVGETFSDTWLTNYVDKNNGKLKRLDKLAPHLPAPLQSDLHGLYLFTGLGARGLTTAPLLAQHLASAIFGKESQLPESLHKNLAPIRFKIKRLKQSKGL